MNQNELLFAAKQEWQTYLHTNNHHFKEKALKLYAEYKKKGGKRKLH